MIIVLMGVTGSGKTTVGTQLARRLGWRFEDADDYHPSANIAKMRRGEPLSDQDREEWLRRLAALIRSALAADENLVLACSALKRAYRRRLRLDDRSVRFVYLRGDYDMVRRRIGLRRDHFAKAELLASQFEALEEPRNALVVDVDRRPSTIVERIVEAFGLEMQG